MSVETPAVSLPTPAPRRRLFGRADLAALLLLMLTSVITVVFQAVLSAFTAAITVAMFMNMVAVAGGFPLVLLSSQQFQMYSVQVGAMAAGWAIMIVLFWTLVKALNIADWSDITDRAMKRISR